MKEQEKTAKQRLQELWISKNRKEVFLSEVRDYERVEFNRFEELMDYIRACAECGYKIG